MAVVVMVAMESNAIQAPSAEAVEVKKIDRNRPVSMIKAPN
jgi:hypothetical protein